MAEDLTLLLQEPRHGLWGCPRPPNPGPRGVSEEMVC